MSTGAGVTTGEVGQQGSGTGANQGHRRSSVQGAGAVREIEVENGMVIPSGASVDQIQPSATSIESGPIDESGREGMGSNQEATHQGVSTTAANPGGTQRGQDREEENGSQYIQNNMGNGEGRGGGTPT